MLIRGEDELEAFGERLGRLLREREEPQILALVGELGAGKTTLTRGIARGLGVARSITSPTFIFMKRYPMSGGGIFSHVDAYRLAHPEDAETIGLPAILQEGGVVVIEWADRIRGAIPEYALWFTLTHHANGRLIEGPPDVDVFSS